MNDELNRKEEFSLKMVDRMQTSIRNLIFNRDSLRPAIHDLNTEKVLNILQEVKSNTAEIQEITTKLQGYYESQHMNQTKGTC